MRKPYSLLIILCTFAQLVSAQLSGTYSAGNLTDDFPSIQDAIDAITQQGMSGTVTIRVSAGSYNTLTLNNIVPPLGSKLIFVSTSSNAQDVTFTQGSIINCERIEIKDLSFIMPPPGTEYSLVSVITSKEIRIVRCRIIDDYNSDTVWNFGPLEVDVGWSGGTHNVHIDSCFITSLEGQIPYSASRQTVLINGQAGKIFFHSDTINGGFDFNFNENREFRNCVLHLPRHIDGHGTDIIDSCDIYFHLGNNGLPGSYELQADVITNNNVFANGGNIDLTSKTVINNYVHGNADCTGGGISLHQNNYFDGDLTYLVASWTSSSINSLFESNIVTGESYFSGVSSGPSYVANNSFLNHVTTGGSGSDLRFYHNNFKPDTWFVCQSWGQMINNNFSDVYFQFIGGLYQGSPTVLLSHNNYLIQDSSSFFYSYYDDNPTYLNPDYDYSYGLHIHNPALYTVAKYLPPSYLSYDMDDEIRSGERSVGADESCLSFPLPDSIQINCGSIYTLELCDSLSDGVHWEPMSLFVDPTSALPSLLVDSIITIYLLDSLDIILDSIVLSTTSSPSTSRDLYGTCNIVYNIATYHQDSSQIHWSPGHLFSDSTSYATSISLDTTTIIVATHESGNCPVRYDSITFHINTYPQIFFIVDSQSCLGRHFQSFTNCFDSTKWEFSDGTTYNDVTDVWHEFPDTGNYQIIYSVWMDGVMATDTVYGFVDCVSLEEILSTDFNIYPNPASNYFFLDVSTSLIGEEYTVCDSQGKTILTGKLEDESTYIKTSNLSSGVYLIRVGQVTKKILLNSSK